MSILTIWLSESNKFSAKALASSVLPTPVGPKNKKDPNGLLGFCKPALDLKTASETASTASSCPITRLCKLSAKCKSFSRSPSTSLLIGIPVILLITSAISLSVTDSSTIHSLGRSLFSNCCSSFSSCGIVACCNLAAFSKS